MATQAGYLLAALDTLVSTSFPDYARVFGLPDASGVFEAPGPIAFIHYAQEDWTVEGNSLSSPSVTRPRLVVTLQRPLTTTGSDLATHQALLELAADLRLAIDTMLYNHVAGIAPIPNFGGAPIWSTEGRMTPARLDIGTGSVESVTYEITLRTVRNYGGR